MPQLKAAVEELQAKGYALPDYPDEPPTDEESEIRARYDKVKGSAVNPVLREGNSDRRAPASVKGYARKHPHSMGAWSPDSKTRVAHMDATTSARTRQSAVDRRRPATLRIELVGDDGTVTVLQGARPGAGRRDGRCHRHARRRAATFLTAQIADAKAEGVLFSLHLKATMMKVSDPIIFGHAVRAFFPDVFAEHGAALARGRRQSQQRPGRASSTRSAELPARRGRHPGRHRGGLAAARRWRWSTPTGASRTCTCRAT